MNFGNWKVDEFGISNLDMPHGSIRIPGTTLDSVVLIDNSEVYKVMLDLDKYPSLTEKCFYDFNDSFLYALGYFRRRYDEAIFRNSLAVQKNLIAIKRIQQILDNDDIRKGRTS
jgi:hypothetical protein